MLKHIQVPYKDLIQLATFLVRGGTFLEDSYQANLAELFRYVRELLVEVATDNDFGSLILLYDILHYLQDPYRLVPHLLRLSRLQVAVEDVHRGFVNLGLRPAHVGA